MSGSVTSPVQALQLVPQQGLPHRRDSSSSTTSTASDIVGSMAASSSSKFLRLTEEPRATTTPAETPSNRGGAFLAASAGMRSGEARELDTRLFMLRRFG